MPTRKGYGMIRKIYINLILATLLCLILCSCTPPAPRKPQPTPPDTVVFYLKHNSSVNKALRKRDVIIYQKGDDILLILPADEFFMKESTNFDFSTLPTIKAIATLLCHFEVVEIKVAGYTDDQEPHICNMAISREWAQIVAHDIWSLCPDARVVYATGYGEFDPIASNDTSSGRELNRRIEITLRLPPPPYVY